MSLDGKVAVVTGASGGIGRGIAECLGEEGVRVVLNDIRADAAEESKRLLAKKGFNTGIAVADICTEAGAAWAVSEAVRFGGRLDLRVNCAGRQII